MMRFAVAPAAAACRYLQRSARTQRLFRGSSSAGIGGFSGSASTGSELDTTPVFCGGALMTNAIAQRPRGWWWTLGRMEELKGVCTQRDFGSRCLQRHALAQCARTTPAPFGASACYLVRLCLPLLRPHAARPQCLVPPPTHPVPLSPPLSPCFEEGGACAQPAFRFVGLLLRLHSCGVENGRDVGGRWRGSRFVLDACPRDLAFFFSRSAGRERVLEARGVGVEAGDALVVDRKRLSILLMPHSTRMRSS
ncbi:hypothetical protein K438DRAFT_488646 [Mycena galopus ATCC 62051]|nr:hypothetical protein K438DRAFT_488646 [Mycena galopus ATCC 62051]